MKAVNAEVKAGQRAGAKLHPFRQANFRSGSVILCADDFGTKVGPTEAVAERVAAPYGIRSERQLMARYRGG